MKLFSIFLLVSVNLSAATLAPDIKVVAFDGGYKNNDIELVTLQRDAKNSNVTALALSFDGKLLCFGDRKGNVSLCEASSRGYITKRKIITISIGDERPVYSLSLSPDKQLLAVGIGEYVYLIDLSTKQHIKRFCAKYDIRMCSIISQEYENQEYENILIIMNCHGHLAFINLKSMTRIKIFKCGRWINTAAISPDGKFLVVGDLLGAIILINMEQEEFVYGPKSLGSGGVQEVLYDPSGKFLAVINPNLRQVNILDCDTKTFVRTFDCDFPIYSIAISRSGEILAAGGRGGVRVWDLNSGQLVQSFAFEGSIVSLAITPNDEHVIGNFRKWNTAAAEIVRDYICS